MNEYMLITWVTPWKSPARASCVYPTWLAIRNMPRIMSELRPAQTVRLTPCDALGNPLPVDFP